MTSIVLGEGLGMLLWWQQKADPISITADGRPVMPLKRRVEELSLDVL